MLSCAVRGQAARLWNHIAPTGIDMQYRRPGHGMQSSERQGTAVMAADIIVAADRLTNAIEAIVAKGGSNAREAGLVAGTWSRPT